MTHTLHYWLAGGEPLDSPQPTLRAAIDAAVDLALQRREGWPESIRQGAVLIWQKPVTPHTVYDSLVRFAAGHGIKLEP